MITFVSLFVLAAAIAVPLLGLFLSRRHTGSKAYIVVPFQGNIRECETTVKGYYYEELFEKVSLRRCILVVCDDNDKPALSAVEAISPTVTLVNDKELLRKIHKEGL